MYLSLHNVMESDDLVQLHAAIVPDDQPKLAVLIFENADQSLLDSLLAPVRNATPDPETQATRNREDQVRIFAKQLLTALQYMHHRSIVHLDLRPEAILLQDDHLRLADFGQSRHLLRGKATGEFQGTPEFVSPEIVNGTAVTLAADMWSTGALIFVLLAGVSPFLGDNDNETLQNVVNANYSLDIPELAEVSAEAKDFIQKLLLLDHTKRMSVDQALEHDWLADPALKDAKLLTDCLREFKYQHKWLERRVFVQQTPSEQLTQLLDTPHQTVAASQHSTPAAAQQAQPSRTPDPTDRSKSPEIVANNGKKAAEALSRSTLPKHIQEQILQQLQQPAPPPPFYDPRSMSPGQPNGHPPATPNGRAEDFAAGDPRRFPGGQPPRHHLRSPGAQLPPASPNQLQPQQRSPGAQRRRLEPQAKGETPSQTGRLSPRRPLEKNEQQEDVPIPPIELVRGTHRDIQLELATRNLSDISEECSIAGSQASLDDFQDEFRVSRKEGRRAKSRSVTPHADSESTTPLASPSLTVDSVDPIQQFFGEQEVPAIPELSDPSVPVGAPLFLEGLGFKPTIVSTSAPLLPAQTLSPGTPGSKSPVIHSPKSEHSMTAVIATKYGKQGRAPGMGDEAAPIEADGVRAGSTARRGRKCSPTGTPNSTS
ncbi:hypothetical protein M3Y99_00353400 [Aphelenchoides fujianensis]|nr:hypothetical protein M3Y99_00353400 [Aphelenchoides fujianensis]